ncbi:glutamine synthetase family protein [Solibaculum mannosilyticum]|uniref:Type I glutamate--ammonia ligase n=1 Tax=Solibaculum mannosilyticum TaxID=2780922 RepID=A0A7I8D6S9_9FIRM|nr:type I glutamate--ammonia ligase [Solibaculum mannosilyticum]CZT55800.1 Glutamine synthetase [Eubacteriaceae bacterium CHKCI005]
MYSYQEVLDFVEQEDVKFIRLAFFDVFGVQKNVSIMPQELRRAFEEGISFDASAVRGFGDEMDSDLFLHPDPSTIAVLPWRPSNGRVVRMYCDIRYPDGRLFERDCRLILKNAVREASEQGIQVDFGSEVEFYLFETDENGAPTHRPFDQAGYMDLSPRDKGENIRREICFTLIDMDIQPEASHHEEGPGQNEIDFHYSDALTSADNTATFKWVVESIAMRNGVWADFSPKPLSDQPGNGMHINLSLKSRDGRDYSDSFMAGILSHIQEMTLFLNPTHQSYQRLGEFKAPKYVVWSPENRSQLIRIPAVKGPRRRIELRSPDSQANPYIAFALLILAGLDGVKNGLVPPPPTNINVYKADPSVVKGFQSLPDSLHEAVQKASSSRFIQSVLPKGYLEAYSRT